MLIWDGESLLTDSDWCDDDEVAFFRLTKIAITVIEVAVIKRMTAVRPPIETPNTRPLTVNELVNEPAVTVCNNILCR